jgi:hypothetical protein
MNQQAPQYYDNKIKIKNTIKTNPQPFWHYETSVGDELCISIKANSKVSLADYNVFINEFIKEYGYRIYDAEKPFRLFDDSLQCLIRLNGRHEISFKNKN